MKKKVIGMLLTMITVLVSVTGLVACNKTKDKYDPENFFGDYVQDKYGSAVIRISTIMTGTEDPHSDYMTGIIPQFVGFTEDGYHQAVTAGFDENGERYYYIITEQRLTTEPRLREYITEKMAMVKEGVRCSKNEVYFNATATKVEVSEYEYNSPASPWGERLIYVVEDYSRSDEDLVLWWTYESDLFGVEIEQGELEVLIVAFDVKIWGNDGICYLLEVRIPLHKKQ